MLSYYTGNDTTQYNHMLFSLYMFTLSLIFLRELIYAFVYFSFLDFFTNLFINWFPFLFLFHFSFASCGSDTRIETSSADTSSIFVIISGYPDVSETYNNLLFPFNNWPLPFREFDCVTILFSTTGEFDCLLFLFCNLPAPSHPTSHYHSLSPLIPHLFSPHPVCGDRDCLYLPLPVWP